MKRLLGFVLLFIIAVIILSLSSCTNNQTRSLVQYSGGDVFGVTCLTTLVTFILGYSLFLFIEDKIENFKSKK